MKIYMIFCGHFELISRIATGMNGLGMRKVRKSDDRFVGCKDGHCQ